MPDPVTDERYALRLCKQLQLSGIFISHLIMAPKHFNYR